MTKKLDFNLGNASLSPAELGIVAHVNERLQASAQRHGITLAPDALLEVHPVDAGGTTLYRVARQGRLPVDIPRA